MLGRDTHFTRFLQQCQDYLWSLALCQLALLAAVAARVDAFRHALQLLLFRRRRQQAVTERQEGIPVAPAEREHAEALHVRAADMVVDAGQQLDFPGTVAAEQGVVDDEDVPACLARQRRDGLLDDGRTQEQRELAPMDGAGVQEAVERVPLERNGIRRILLPLVEGAPLEHRLERDEEDGHDRKAAQLVGIAAPQNLADMKLSKELLNLGRSGFTGVMMMWYNIHSISPPVLLWIFGHFHYTKWR